MKKTSKQIRNNEIERLEKIPYNQTPRKGIDSGAYGKKIELELTPKKSQKKRVAGHNESDNYFYLDGKKESIEIKTNGGRIENLLKIKTPQKSYIAYKIHLCNSTTGGKLIDIAPRIMTVSHFLEILNAVGAVRMNSDKKEHCIQVSKRGLWQAMEKELVYDPNRHYTIDEIQ